MLSRKICATPTPYPSPQGGGELLAARLPGKVRMRSEPSLLWGGELLATRLTDDVSARS